MSTPFLGQLQLFPFGFAPKGWAICAGQTMAINQNQALFAVLGTTYGGNGVTTFQLPNLQGRTPIGYSNNYPIGAVGGTETHTLTTTEVSAHTHTLTGTSAAANLNTAAGHMLGALDVAT